MFLSQFQLFHILRVTLKKSLHLELLFPDRMQSAGGLEGQVCCVRRVVACVNLTELAPHPRKNFLIFFPSIIIETSDRKEIP